jgi:hypothetical protein
MEANNIGMTGIIPFTYFGGVQKLVGSTFLRVDCLCKNDSNFEKWVHGKKYDNLIFQKAYWIEMMELFDGPKILDICDPDWIKEQLDIVNICKYVHAITCSSESLTELVKNYFPNKLVVNIPDRLDFSVYPLPREKHALKAKNIVWFGFIHNAHETLEQMLPVIKEYGLNLKIIADRPYSKEDGILALKPEYAFYDPRFVYEQIKEADIVLNPKSDKAFYKYKSNNKSLISWKLGLPVAHTNDELIRFINPDERNKEIAEKQQVIYREYQIQTSLEQYKNIILKIRQQYFSNL